MSLLDRFEFSSVAAFIPSLFTCFLAGALLFTQRAAAQDDAGHTLVGYVTAVRSANDFDVNEQQHVVVSPNTKFGLDGGKGMDSASPLRAAIQVGAYVRVIGTVAHATKTTQADQILIRNDRDRKLSGLGVIERVATAGSEPELLADGYRVRVTSATETSFKGEIKTLSEAKAGVWLHFEGRRDGEGTLVASKAVFLPLKPTKLRPLQCWEDSLMVEFQPPSTGRKENPKRCYEEGDASMNDNPPPFVDFPTDDDVLKVDGHVRIGASQSRHKIPADMALQARVRRVGMRLVPAFQKQMAAGDPAKIPFHFYAVDAKNFNSDVVPFDGLVLIPAQLVERLKTDDQLAAALADGVANSLQLQQSKIANFDGTLLGAYTVGGLAAVGVGELVKARVLAEMEQERGRIALALMEDAGYDPWQAPEAWRLMAPKQLPKDLDSLKYPDRSGYQLSVLSLQYKDARAQMGK